MNAFTVWIKPPRVFRHRGIYGDAVVVSTYNHEVHTKPWVGLEGHLYDRGKIVLRFFVMNGKAYYPSEQPEIP